MQADTGMSALEWVVADDQAVISVPIVAGGELVVRFTTDDRTDPPDLDTASPAVRRVLELAGAWDDLDPDEVLDQLERLRDASPPSASLALDDQ